MRARGFWLVFFSLSDIFWLRFLVKAFESKVALILVPMMLIMFLFSLFWTTIVFLWKRHPRAANFIYEVGSTVGGAVSSNSGNRYSRQKALRRWMGRKYGYFGNSRRK